MSEQTTLDSCQLAYFAGFFDGEGCIFPHIPDGTVHLVVCNTKPKVLYELQKRLGGSIRHYPPSRDGERTVYQWGIFNRKDCLNALKRLYPYLIIKRKQAEIAIELLEKMPRGMQGGGLTPQLRKEEWERRRPLLALLKEMNKKGTGRKKS